MCNEYVPEYPELERFEDETPCPACGNYHTLEAINGGFMCTHCGYQEGL